MVEWISDGEVISDDEYRRRAAERTSTRPDFLAACTDCGCGLFALTCYWNGDLLLCATCFLQRRRKQI